MRSRIVFWLQWIAPIAMPLLVVFGRQVLGGRGGWLSFVLLFVGVPVLALAMYVPAIITLFDREVRRTRRTRPRYSTAALLHWAAYLGVMVAFVDYGDMADDSGSVLTAMGLPEPVSWVLTIAFAGAAFAAYVVMVITASVGVSDARAARQPS